MLFRSDDRAQLDLVVCADDGDQVAPLDFGDGALRHQQRVLQRADRGPHLAEQSRPEKQVRVGEDRADLEGAGGRVDLSVKQQEAPFFAMDTAVGENQFERDVLGLGVGRAADVAQVFLFAQAEIDLDRVDA